MKKTLFILILLIASLLYYSGVFTQKETLPFSREFFTVETAPTEGFLSQWREGKTLPKAEGDPKRSFPNPKDLDALYQLKLDRGIRNVPTLSAFLIREARFSRKSGQSQQALGWATYAVQFSPDHPRPYFERAWIRWTQDPFRIYPPLLDVWNGTKARFQYFPESLPLFYNLFYLFTNALLMAFVVFAIVILVKDLPLYLYEIRKTLNQEISRLAFASVKLFLLFIPFFFRLDLLWALFFYLILLWGVLDRRERRFLIFFLVVLTYVPSFLKASSSFLDQSASEILQDLHRGNYEDGDAATERRLKTWLSQHADDRDVIFTLGLMAKKQGLYGQAEEYYRRVIQLAPSWNEGYTHLGNVYFARKQTEQAVAAYQQAIELNPNQAAPYFNLYRAYAQETFLSSKIDRAFQKARQLDPQLVDAYTSIDHPPHANRLVIDLPLSATVFWGRFYHQFIGREGLLFRLFKIWFEWIPSRLSFLTPLVFLFFLIVMSKVTRNKRYVTRCPMCGNPTYRFYLGQEEKEFLCFNCYRISVQKEKFHSKITDRKAQQIREFKQTNHRVGRVISFLLLGFQDLWEDRPVKGFVLQVLFFFFLLRIVHWNGVIPYPGGFYPSSLGGGIVWSGCFVLFYFLMVWRKRKVQTGSHPREERTGKP